MALLLTVIFILQKSCKKTMQRYGFRSKNKEIDVDQNLPPFYRAVKLSEAEWIVSEANYYWNNYGLRLIPLELYR
jgi:hypothetical protein